MKELMLTMINDIGLTGVCVFQLHDEWFKKSWNTCERGDWMLWYIAKNKERLVLEDMRLITKAKALCANLVIHLMKDERSKEAIRIAIKFGEGNATRNELDAAAADLTIILICK